MSQKCRKEFLIISEGQLRQRPGASWYNHDIVEMDSNK